LTGSRPPAPPAARRQTGRTSASPLSPFAGMPREAIERAADSSRTTHGTGRPSMPAATSPDCSSGRSPAVDKAALLADHCEEIDSRPLRVVVSHRADELLRAHQRSEPRNRRIVRHGHTSAVIPTYR
jgi:hypothetical protein